MLPLLVLQELVQRLAVLQMVRGPRLRPHQKRLRARVRVSRLLVLLVLLLALMCMLQVAVRMDLRHALAVLVQVEAGLGT